jgi:hypothetical protein
VIQCTVHNREVTQNDTLQTRIPADCILCSGIRLSPMRKKIVVADAKFLSTMFEVSDNTPYLSQNEHFQFAKQLKKSNKSVRKKRKKQTPVKPFRPIY